MKRLIISALLTVGLASPLLAATPYSPAIQAKWCWDTGTYWVAQRAQYPDYYARPDVIAKESARYGSGTRYC